VAQEGSKPKTGDGDYSEECHYVLALFLYSPQVSIIGLHWKQTTSSRDLLSPLVQSHVDGSPSGKTSGKCRVQKIIQDKICISLLTFQINSNGLRPQFYFYFLISWVKRKWLVTVNLSAAQCMSVSTNTTQNIQVTFKKDFYGYSILKGCWTRSMDAN